MEVRIVEGLGVPAAIGPYSAAVRAGEFVFISGQPGVDPVSGEVVGPRFGEQARQSFANLEAVLAAAGSSPRDVVSTTVVVANVDDFAELNALFEEFFYERPPARMTMQVPLPRGLLISIGCTAVVS